MKNQPTAGGDSLPTKANKSQNVYQHQSLISAVLDLEMLQLFNSSACF